MSLERPSTLPPELERGIFEIAAFIHPSCMPALILVAQRVKIWIEPLLYRVLCIGPKPLDSEEIWVTNSRQRIRHLMEGRRVALFHDHVRHLCLNLSGTVFLDDIVLRVCDATINIHLSGGNSQLLLHLEKLPLQRLSVNLKYLFSLPDFTHPLFATITHLSLDNPYYHWPQMSSLTQMPCLTHLSFNEILLPETTYENALRDCKSLEVLATSWSRLAVLRVLIHNRTYASIATDLRVVVLLATDHIRDWQMGARGGDDYWVRADEHVRKRRAGETNGKSLVSFVVEHTVIIRVAPEYYLLSDD
ncbi:hypothetical protein B0H11DRAFT_2231396 [Mycena galericulata]|nr:hypothetical protein B0H11DRAFT_2231396 [Mycena galericulata]